MKKILILLLFPVLCFGQGGYYNDNKSDVSQICDIYKGNSFTSNLEAENALQKIIQVSGISKRFVLHSCSNIDNCIATTIKGIRYILYDKYFMQEITNNTNSWSKLSILAHEVGHHVNGHPLDLIAVLQGKINPPSLKQSRIMEIEADEFSGFILQKMGASLSQAQAAINKYGTHGDDSYSTHPSKVKRLAAIERGFKKALNEENSGNEVYKTEQGLTAEDYFYKAMNLPNNEESVKSKIKNYTNAINLGFQYKFVAYNNRGNSKRDLNDFVGAIKDFSNAIKYAPEDVNFLSIVYKNRAEARAHYGDLDGAISDCNKGLELNPKDNEFYFNRALIKQYQSKPYCGDLKIACELGHKEACSRYEDYFCR